MTTEKSKISLKFVFVICLLMVGVVAFIYLQENKKFANSETVSALVVGSRVIPKLCLIEAKVESGQYGGNILRVSVPSWDSRKAGDRIKIRVDRNDRSIVEVDEPFYLHRTSFGLLAGTMALGVILVGVFVFKKR